MNNISLPFEFKSVGKNEVFGPFFSIKSNAVGEDQIYTHNSDTLIS